MRSGSVGVLYRRITSIKLPGGGEIALTPSEKSQVERKVQSTVKAQVMASGGDDAKATEYLNSNQDVVAGIADVVAVDLSKTKAVKGVAELDQTDIDAAVTALVPEDDHLADGFTTALIDGRP